MNSQASASLPRSVWLLQHGQTDWNLARRYLSVSDRPLTPFGQRQAHALARFFSAKKIDVILHTGLQRTQLTAEAIRGQRPILVARDEAWREAAHGAWEGLTYREVMRQFPQDAQQRLTDPVNHAPLAGEALAQMAERVLAAWRTLGQQFPGQRVVIITHAGPIQALLCQRMGTPLAEHWRWRIDMGSASGFDVYPTTTILRAVNWMPTL